MTQIQRRPGIAPRRPRDRRFASFGRIMCAFSAPPTHALLGLNVPVSGTVLGGATNVRLELDGWATQTVPVTGGAWSCSLVWDSVVANGNHTLTATPLRGAVEGEPVETTVFIYAAPIFHVPWLGISKVGSQINTWSSQGATACDFTAAANYPDSIEDDSYFQDHDTVDFRKGLSEAFVADDLASELSETGAFDIIAATQFAKPSATAYLFSNDDQDLSFYRHSSGLLVFIISSPNYVTAGAIDDAIDCDPHVIGLSFDGAASPRASIYVDGVFANTGSGGTIPAAVPTLTSGFWGKGASATYLSQRTAGIWTWPAGALSAADHAIISALIHAALLETPWWTGLAVAPSEIIDPEWGVRTNGSKAERIPLVMSGNDLYETTDPPTVLVDSNYGGFKTINADGTQWLDADSFAALLSDSTGFTLFVVGSIGTPASNKRFFDTTVQQVMVDKYASNATYFRLGGSDNFVTATIDDGRYVYAFHYVGGGSPIAEIYVNGSKVSGAPTGTIPAAIGTIAVGGLFGSTVKTAFLGGRVATMLLFQPALSGANITSVTNALMTRYGIS